MGNSCPPPPLHYSHWHTTLPPCLASAKLGLGLQHGGVEGLVLLVLGVQYGPWPEGRQPLLIHIQRHNLVDGDRPVPTTTTQVPEDGGCMGPWDSDGKPQHATSTEQASPQGTPTLEPSGAKSGLSFENHAVSYGTPPAWW